eukprot:8798815-Pyramimonas_sp.AAC.2
MRPERSATTTTTSGNILIREALVGRAPAACMGRILAEADDALMRRVLQVGMLQENPEQAGDMRPSKVPIR